MSEQSSTSMQDRSRPVADDPVVAAALVELVAEGTLTPHQAERVGAVLAVAGADGRLTASRGGRLAEIAGYLGGALLLGAAALFLTSGWDDLGEAARVTVLAALSAALLGAGWFVVGWSGHRARALGADRGSARRRLVSVLWTFGAASAAGATGLGVDGWELVAGSVVGLVVAGAGYALVPGLVAQLGLWAGSVALVTGLVAELGDQPDATAYGIALVALGGLWVALGLTGVVRDREPALATGAAIALFGAQLPVLDGGHEWVGYALTAGVAVAGFAGHLWTRSWSVLGAGVLATTLVVPEALHDWTEGSVSAAGSLLVAGLTLLAASALGLRMRAG